MVRTRTTGQDGQPPVPPARAARGQGCGRGYGRGRGAARTSARAAPTDPPVAPAQEQVVQGLQIPGALPAQPVTAAQALVTPIMADDDQRRLERFGRLRPPSFSGAESEDDQGFLDRATFKWWKDYERRRPVGATPLTWLEFSVLFLEKFMSQSHREELHRQFEQLRQDGISVTQERVSGATFDKVVDIAQQIEMVCREERGEREAKRPRGPGDFSGVPSGGDLSSLSALPAQSSSHAPLVQGSSAPGSSSEYSGARGSLQSPLSLAGKDCFECGDMGHIKRYCPRLMGGPAQQRRQPMTSALVTSPPAQPARGRA
ncbi:uncharacterized protein [Nicotiana tomentosiformis]|uniref:uncharacterized protein n=1 Tax=Nicotiana tomentosiformis TaxID=4098 RepID=UPI00388C8C3D